ncbi:MAG: DUF421 domain-containing protein [Clostridia bacterium]|nr:DUF421 domain-containing protein [Clostridia bacterium]
MTTIFIRTIIIYVILIGSMRLMGKRQIGQLEVSDLVSTLLLSEIAALPVENREIPLSYAIIPIVIVMTAEIVTAAIQQKFPTLKNFFSPRPGVLIRMGKPDFKELSKARMSADELMVALRHTGTTDIDEVAYAILEQDGSVSVIPRAKYKPATAEDVGAATDETGIFHIIIDRGIVNDNSLSAIGKDERWLDHALRHRGTDISRVTLMLADESGSIRLFTAGQLTDQDQGDHK